MKNVSNAKKLTFALLLNITFLIPAYANEASNSLMIQSSVAPEFIEGLDAKYLHYLADKLSVNIKLTPMPFARRLIELEQGNIDIMVGLLKENKLTNNFILIEPAYYSSTSRLFSLKENAQKITQYEDLEGKLVGTIRFSKYLPEFDNNEKIIKVATSTLAQNINMLLSARTDMFIHFEESTLLTLKELSVEHLITKTPFQFNNNNQFFIGISTTSSLVKRQDELEEIIINGLKNNDFLRMKNTHFNKKTKQKYFTK